MKKQLTALVMATMFLAGTAAIGVAGDAICEVKSVDGTNVVIDCGPDAKKMNVGDKVKIKVKKATKQAIEGC